MHSQKPKQKLTVMTKTIQPKKPNLEINTTNTADPALKSMPTGFSSFQEDPLTNQYKSVSTVTSPSNKNIKPIVQVPEIDEANKKKNEPGKDIVKKGSNKETQLPKVELQPRMSANQLTSPKAGINKDKIVISYGSEKNLGNIKPVQKKQTPQSKQNRIEELERQIEQEKVKSNLLVSKQNQLSLIISQLQKQNQHLKQQNTELKKKIEKYKSLNGETKQLLKERINHFNEQGGEMQALKMQIKTLQSRVQNLLNQNQKLKTELNKVSDYNLEHMKSFVPDNLAVSTVREVVPLHGSRVSGLYLKDAEGELKQFTGIEKVQENLDLQSYISEQQESYLQEYKENVGVFERIKKEYEEILTQIEQRYKKIVKNLQDKVASQAAQLYQIQIKNDELNEVVQSSLHGSRCSQTPLSLGWDQAILRKQQQNASLNLAIYDLRQQGKELVEQTQHLRAQCQFLQAELQVQRMKKQFTNQNDKFEFNVVKLNLLNIIDKLKMQVDKEKRRNKTDKELISTN